METLRVGTGVSKLQYRAGARGLIQKWPETRKYDGGIWSTLLAGQDAHPISLLIDNPPSETYRPHAGRSPARRSHNGQFPFFAPFPSFFQFSQCVGAHHAPDGIESRPSRVAHHDHARIGGRAGRRLCPHLALRARRPLRRVLQGNRLYESGSLSAP